MKKPSIVLFMFIFTATSSFAQLKNKTQGIDSSKQSLTNFIKIRGSIDSAEETVFYATGNIYSFIPEQQSKLLFTFEMYNIARFVKNETGYTMLSREMLVYKDPQTNKILKTWFNPFTKDSVEVITVWNDPVNALFKENNFAIDYISLGNDRACIYTDLPLLYPSPLKKADWPKNSRSDWYQAAELFQFFFNEKDIMHRKSKTVSCDISWTRFCDFLPWMQMSDRPGYLLYQSRGYKLQNGWADLPQNIKDYVLANNLPFVHAPEKYSSPNMTSWKYFKKQMEEKNKK